MMEELLPGSVVTVEAHGGDALGDGISLYPEEEAVIARAVDKRRREFTAARGCARAAMEKLGVPPGPVLPGERGAPRWPDGLVGSLTHCRGYRAAVVAPVSAVSRLGIDAEPHAALSPGVLRRTASAGELRHLAELRADHPAVHWDRLMFCAKEAVYKAWFPLTGRWLDFLEADVAVDPGAGTFRARVLVPGDCADGRVLTGFDGRWHVADGLVVAGITGAA